MPVNGVVFPAWAGVDPIQGDLRRLDGSIPRVGGGRPRARTVMGLER